MPRPRSYFARPEGRPAPSPARMAEILASHAGASLMSGAGSEHHPEQTMSAGGGAITAGDLRAGAVLPHATGTESKSIASGPAGQEAGEVRGVPPAGKTPTINGSSGEVTPITSGSTGSVGGDAVRPGIPAVLDNAAAAALQWHDPVKTPGGGYLRSVCLHYSVVKERTETGWRYLAFFHSTVMGAANGVEAGKQMCQEHARGMVNG